MGTEGHRKAEVSEIMLVKMLVNIRKTIQITSYVGFKIGGSQAPFTKCSSV